MRYKIYASDEGFGHLVRQHAIMEQLRELCPNIEVTLQTHRNLPMARRLYKNVEFIERFNNVTWSRLPNGSPDLEKIKASYCDYLPRSDAYLQSEQNIDEYDFIVSDFVYEAFPAAARDRVPAFGVAHFTWDWFFSKLYPIPLSTAVLRRWQTYAQAADVLFFPPFTPRDLLDAYRSKVVETPLIVGRPQSKPAVEHPGRLKVLVMDSGANVISQQLAAGLKQARGMSDCQFFVSEKFGVEGENITQLSPTSLFADYIPAMDLVLTRGGFNTVSECIAYRTPMLLVGEPLNPEMQNNLLQIKQRGLGSFVSLEYLTADFPKCLRHFRDVEFEHVRQALAGHDIPIDGAHFIAERILNRVSRAEW